MRICYPSQSLLACLEDFKHPVYRYVVTHIGRSGDRVVTFGNASDTHETPEKPQRFVDAVETVNSVDTLVSVFGKQALGTFEVRLCPCWPKTLESMDTFVDNRQSD